MNLKIIQKLIDILNNTDVVELEWTPDRIHIIRGGVTQDTRTSRIKDGEKRRPAERERPTVTITSPLVGTFYRSASPETQPFVQIGDKVMKEQIMCVIEAMKLMNEIESHVDGVVTAILKQDGERVGYGDQLFIVEEL